MLLIISDIISSVNAANIFFFCFFITILITRVLIYFKPTSSPTVFKLRLHHYMYGIVAILGGFILRSMIVVAFGLGLFIDELTYILIKGKSHTDNYSPKSIIGTVLFIILIFLFREKLVAILTSSGF